MLKIKVCGMRELDNISDLVQLKPDFIGFIFHENSPRNISEFPDIVIPDNIHKVGVFVNKSFDFILSTCRENGLNTVQLHGHEFPIICKQLKNENLKVIKAFNIKEGFDFSILKAYESSCDYFLFDAFGKKPGGNNIKFNWDLLNEYKGQTPFLLSGGINSTMVEDIKTINHACFAGIDINSGFELKPALKNIERIKTFKDELYSR